MFVLATALPISQPLQGQSKRPLAKGTSGQTLPAVIAGTMSAVFAPEVLGAMNASFPVTGRATFYGNALVGSMNCIATHRARLTAYCLDIGALAVLRFYLIYNHNLLPSRALHY